MAGRPEAGGVSAAELVATLSYAADPGLGQFDLSSAQAISRREWPAGLTAREVEVLGLLARGHSNS